MKSPDAISPVSPAEEPTISPKSPVTSAIPNDPPSSIDAVLSQEPATNTASTSRSDDTIAGDQPLQSEPETVTSPIVTEDTSVIPDLPVTAEPIAEPVPTIDEPVANPNPKSDDEEVRKPSHAQTIDEAIAEFQTAVKTPEPESHLASEELSAVERDDTAEPEKTETEALATEPVVNGVSHPPDQSDQPHIQKSALLRTSSDDIPATAPRVIARTPPPPPKDATATHGDDDVEGVTMEDIEID